MSILIPDMKMPKDNPVTINIYRDGSWVNAYTKENGEAIEVPTPHGRLVDCDEVFQRLKRFSIANPDLQEKTDNDFCALARWLVTAPTIIGAEGE